jgi:ubiquinone/menaquinone biosynthesis C-methylase UbiE
MATAGWHGLVSVDCSPAVISRMAKQCGGALGMRWEVQDIRRMTYADASFDAVVDKATIDALLADRSQADEDGVSPAVAACLTEICRVLKPGGSLVWVSFGARKTALLQRAPWGAAWDLVDRVEVGDPGCITFDVYHVTKKKTR